MAQRPVLHMGNPKLRLESRTLTEEEIKSKETRLLIQDMLDTMNAEDGIGIAAPQIGVNQQVALIGMHSDNPRYEEAEEIELLVVINPNITILDHSVQGYWEGCLSVPGLRGYVERPHKIRLEYQDLDAEYQSLEAEGFLATVIQHEIDHLFGKLYIDRVEDTTKISFLEEFKEYWISKE